MVWKEVDLSNWEPVKAPGAFSYAEFMFKDAHQYAETKGWGWARWKGLEQIPYGENGDFAQECIACHTSVAGRDHVFTDPTSLPQP